MSKIKINKLPKSEVEIEGEIEPAIFESYFTKAVKKIGQNFQLPGFRQGKVPEQVLLKNVPEMHILEEMAELALSEEYPKIIAENKIDAISRPAISITKLARNNPLGFKIRTAVMPDLKLPDYKKLARVVLAGLTEEDKKTEVTDEELENTVLDIRKSRAQKVKMKDATSPQPSPGEERGKPGGEVLPELTDEFVKSLGPFENVADFKQKLRENLKLEKENQNKEKTRLKIVEKIIAETATELPEILVHVELDKIIHRMQSDIAAMGLKFEDYLKHLNKTVEDLRKDFRADAEKKAKLGLVLNEIAKVEKIQADPAQVDKEVAMILEHYKDADPDRARLHAESVLTNEKIFQFLESQGVEK